MKNPKLSIIIPVYNVQQYLRECLDSIIAQTFTDWECLLIDDGSIDKSSDICDEYSRKDSRFIVKHQQNRGQAAARNVALTIFKGDYVTFLDSDDKYGDNITLDDLMSFMKENINVDALQFPFYEYLPNGSQNPLRSYNNDIIIESNLNTLLNFQSGKISTLCADKLFRRDIVENLRFPEGMYFEDECFIIDALTRINTFAFSSKGKYLYRIRKGSTTHPETFNLRLTIDLFKKDFYGISVVKENKNLTKLYLRYYYSSIREYMNANLLSLDPVLNEYKERLKKLSPSLSLIFSSDIIFSYTEKIYSIIIKVFGFKPIDMYITYKRSKRR